MSTEQLRVQARNFIDAPTWSFRLPAPAEVGEFYDRNGQVLTELMGGSVHYGYWRGPDDDSGFDVAAARLTDVVVEKLGLAPGDHVLDLGCGTGKPAVQLARATGARVTGVSVSTEEVALANALAESEGIAGQVRFQYADAMDLRFPEDSFDAVLALESLVHIPDRVAVLTQVARVLRPGGRLALTDFCTLPAGPDDDLGEQRALAEVLAAWCTAPLIRSEDYPGFARTAGLAVDEIVDLTEPTKYTAERIYASMRAYLERHGSLPADLAHIYDLGADVEWSEVTAEPPTEGVILVVAHRPAAEG